MGFRDLKKLNQALLARQEWRLIEYVESLCPHIMKAKYYPNDNLLDTAFPSNSCYVESNRIWPRIIEERTDLEGRQWS